MTIKNPNEENTFYADIEVQRVRINLTSITKDCDPDIATKIDFLRTMEEISTSIFGRDEGGILFQLLDRTPKFHRALYEIIKLHFRNPEYSSLNGKLLWDFLRMKPEDQVFFLLSHNTKIKIIEDFTGLTEQEINLLNEGRKL